MYSISKTQRKILQELGENARITYKELAKKISSKKTTVSYNIQNLIDDGVIWKFVPVFSINKIGLNGYKIYLRLHRLDKAKKEEIINFLVKDQDINWVAETTGAWDLLWSTLSKSPLEFAKKKDEFFEKYSEYIQEHTITILEDALVFNRDYLTNKKIDYRKKFVFGGERKKEELDEVEKSIMKEIANDGRYQVTKLANSLNLNVKTVMSKIKDLENKEVIQGYTVFIDIQKLGLKFFKLCVHLSDFSDKNYKDFLEYCKINKNIIHIIKPLGGCDLELEIETESVDSIYSFIEDIKMKYPKTVKKVDIVIIKKEHKLDFLPNNF